MNARRAHHQPADCALECKQALVGRLASSTNTSWDKPVKWSPAHCQSPEAVSCLPASAEQLQPESSCCIAVPHWPERLTVCRPSVHESQQHLRTGLSTLASAGEPHAVGAHGTGAALLLFIVMLCRLLQCAGALTGVPVALAAGQVELPVCAKLAYKSSCIC